VGIGRKERVLLTQEVLEKAEAKKKGAGNGEKTYLTFLRRRFLDGGGGPAGEDALFSEEGKGGDGRIVSKG